MDVNLRKDHTFVQDAGWYAACSRYEDFIGKYKNKRILFLELGVGYNTPGIIKYPFWQMCYQNPDATYVCMNLNDTFAPDEIKSKAILVEGDIGKSLEELVRL